MRRLLALAILVSEALMLLGLRVVYADREATPVTFAARPELAVRTPRDVAAGSPIRVEIVDRQRPRTSVLRLLVVNGSGVRSVAGRMTQGRAVIEVPGLLLRHAGRTVVIAQTTRGLGRATLTVHAARVADGVVALAGPRSMVADASHWTMVTAIPTDRFGNGVPDGTEVTVHVRRPDGSAEQIRSTVRELVTGVRVWSGTRAGLTTVRIESEGSTGPEIEVEEVPGPPVPFRLVDVASRYPYPGGDPIAGSAAEPIVGSVAESVAESVDDPRRLNDATGLSRRSDGRSILRIATEPLVDAFGNVVLDGSAVEFTAETPEGRVRQVNTTINGVATMHLEAPQRPGPITITATARSAVSEPLTLSVAPGVERIEAQARRTGGQVEFSVRAESLVSGGFVPDGTLADFITGGRVFRAQMKDGAAAIRLDLPRDAKVRVRVLGAMTDLEVP
jgi:hypothetical protein